MEINLRNMEEKDISNIYEYIHKKYIHKYYPGKEQEEWERHFRWYSFMLYSSSYIFYIVEIENEFIGTIRYELEGETAIVSIFLREEYRGQGYGKHTLLKSIEKILSEIPLETIEAKILEENENSKKLFLSCGFLTKKKEEYSYQCMEK